jgi:hypothetical protein
MLLLQPIQARRPLPRRPSLNRYGSVERLAKVAFTQNIQRHVTCRDTEASGDNVRAVLDNLFAGNPRARSYVLDDQAALRRHMNIFIDGEMIRDRVHLSDPVNESSNIYVFQALSGG